MTSNNQDLNPGESFTEKSIEQETDLSENTPIPPSATTNEIPNFGWSSYAERINGRFAMLGLTAVLLIELLSQTSFLDWAGIIK